jgi:hypothetical protein
MMSVDETRRLKAERLLRWHAASSFMLLGWVVGGPLIAFGLFRLEMRSISLAAALAFGIVAAGVGLRIYFAACPNCARPLYIFRWWGSVSTVCRRCGMSLEEMAAS